VGLIRVASQKNRFNQTEQVFWGFKDFKNVLKAKQQVRRRIHQ
jgi:hypothetical protein